MDVRRVRKDFPILKTGLIYFDNAASSLTPNLVLRSMDEYYREFRANVHRGVHRLSQKASEEYERAHDKVAEFINAGSGQEIVMTRNTTEGINLLANGLKWRRGDRIVTTLIEHHSNYVVWLRLKKLYGVDMEVVRPDSDGIFRLSDFEKAVNDRTKLVTITHVSNVLGVKLPVKDIGRVAKDHGAYYLVDGAQSVPHLKVDVEDIGCDFLAFSGHKMCGPTGSGVLYIKAGREDDVMPAVVGGGAVRDVDLDDYTLAESPARFEAGTPGISEAIGLGSAVDYLNNVGMTDIIAHEKKLTAKLYDGLKSIPNVDVYGPPPEFRLGIVAFNVGDLNPHDASLALDVSAGIETRSGHHCALPLHKVLLKQPKGTVRASIYLYNTEDEVDKFLSAVGEIAESMS